MDLEQIIQDVKKNLSPFRFEHSLRVMERISQLANIYHMDLEKAKKVGIAHDIAKELSAQESLQYVKDYTIEIDEIEKRHVALLHGKIGANIARDRYGFDEQMQKAIEYHIYGNENMDLLAKILFAADKTEAGRKDEKIDIEYERTLADTDIDEAILYMLDAGIKKMMINQEIIHPQSIYTRNYFLVNRKKEG